MRELKFRLILSSLNRRRLGTQSDQTLLNIIQNSEFTKYQWSPRAWSVTGSKSNWQLATWSADGPVLICRLSLTCLPPSSVHHEFIAFLLLLLLSRSVLSDSGTPWTVAHQAPLSMGLSRQEYWSGLVFPSPGDLPLPGIKPTSPVWQPESLPLSHLGSPVIIYYLHTRAHTHIYHLSPV